MAAARAHCLYCGQALGPAAPLPREPAASPEPLPREPPRGMLVLLDLAGMEPGAVAEALALPAYEAALLARRGGLHLVRRAPAREADSEVERLQRLGAACWLVPEAEVREPPLACLAGESRADSLELRTSEGPVTLARGELLLVVRGPIARAYQTAAAPRRITTARLEEGYRVQLHRRAAPRPLEIDAYNFEVGFAPSGAVRLELDAWVEAVRGRAPRDDGFRNLPPALAPAAPEPKSALAAASSLGGAQPAARDGRPLMLDNLEQFRFYSGCLAAVARRREAPPAA